MLGPIEVRSESGSAATLPRAQRRIIAVLAAEEGGVVSLDRLMDVLHVSKAAIQTAVSRTRDSIGVDSIATRPDGYALGEVDLDVDRFCELIQRAAGAQTLDREIILGEALALWRGEPFAEFIHEDWTRPAAVRLGEIHSTATEDHAKALLDAGRPRESAAAMRAHVERHPLRDRPREILMSALSAQGRSTEALRVARDYRRYLDETVGTTPSATFDHLERSIASGTHTAAPLPSQSTRISTTNVGPEPNRLVDRPEIDQVVELLASARLVTMVGPGGIGKSRCAIAIARRFVERLDAAGPSHRTSGVWFVDLASTDDRSTDLTVVVSEAIGLRRQAGLTRGETIVQFLQDRSTLLVLDNCEHVIASARDLSSALLDQCPGLVILATSRLRMRTSTERVVDVAPMAPESAAELFEARVAECGAGPFQRTDVAALCEQLDNYPLALELAAGGTRVLSPAEILARFVAHPASLDSNTVDGPSRHTSLATALEWSLAQLGPEATSILHSMTVFRGAFDLASALAVVGSDVETEVFLGLLETLVEHHLLRRDHATARFRILEPIRQHLASAAPLTAELEERHARYFAAFTRRAVRDKFTEAEAAASRALRRSLPDVRAAVQWAIANQDPTLVEFMMERMAMTVSAEVFIEGGEWAERALAAFEADAAEMPATALAAAVGCFWLERFEESERLFDRVATTTTGPLQLGILEMVQGFVAIFSGDFARAAQCARRCGEIGRTIGEPIFELQPLITEMDPAAIEVADRLGSPSRSAVARWFAWLSLDVNLRGQSRLPDEGVALAFESGDPYVIAQGLSFLASRLLRSGDTAQGAGELANAVERMLRLRSPTLVWAAVDQSASALAIIDGQQDGAVTLWSALEGAGRASAAQTYMVPGTVEAARAALSSTELEMATLAGSVLSMDAAVAFALERLDQVAKS